MREIERERERERKRERDKERGREREKEGERFSYICLKKRIVAAMVVTLETSPIILVSTSTVPSACDCPRLNCRQLSQRGRHVAFTASKPSKQDTAGVTMDGVSVDSVVASLGPSVSGSI